MKNNSEKRKYDCSNKNEKTKNNNQPLFNVPSPTSKKFIKNLNLGNLPSRPNSKKLIKNSSTKNFQIISKNKNSTSPENIMYINKKNNKLNQNNKKAGINIHDLILKEKGISNLNCLLQIKESKNKENPIIASESVLFKKKGLNNKVGSILSLNNINNNNIVNFTNNNNSNNSPNFNKSKILGEDTSIKYEINIINNRIKIKIEEIKVLNWKFFLNHKLRGFFVHYLK